MPVRAEGCDSPPLLDSSYANDNNIIMPADDDESAQASRGNRGEVKSSFGLIGAVAGPAACSQCARPSSAKTISPEI